MVKNLTVVYKGSHEWNKIYKNKTSAKKGYKDVTDMLAESITEDKSSDNKKAVDIKDNDVKQLFNDLMAFANKSIKKNYKVTQDAVTQAQVDAAQEVLNNAVKKLKKGVNKADVNNLLLELYTIIPRQMKDVKDYLIKDTDTADDIDIAKNFLANEQDTLDTMAGQVKLLKQQKEADKTTEEDKEETNEITLLEQMGLTVEVETDADSLELVNKLLGSNASRAKRIFKCINKKTQAIFDENYKKAKTKKRRLYWHGSRNENWFNIIQTGLMIRPSGAVHTGSMFGDGIYFANKSQKSLGYTSVRGSYWAGGSSTKGYLALFDVHTGDQKHIHKHDSSCYRLSKAVLDKEGKDSVYAHGGIDLRNDEFIVYDGKQCTIAYIIEME